MFLTRDVWGEMDRLRREMNSLLSGSMPGGGGSTFPLLNVYDDKDSLVVTAELPGMSKEQVTITYGDGVLTLSGNRQPLQSARKMSALRQERSTGEFEKSVRLPSKVDQAGISASFVNGILTITLPKSEEAKPKTIHIEAH